MSMQMPEAGILPEPAGFKIELSDFTLVVTDLSKPMWHGQYQAGVLSIYFASVEVATADGLDDSKLPGGDTYVIVYSIPNEPDFFSYASYTSEVTQEQIVSHILQMVTEHYNLTSDVVSLGYTFPEPKLAQ